MASSSACQACGGRPGSEPDRLEVFRKFLLEKIQNLLGFGRPGRVLDAGVNVLGVLAEDDHVHFLRMLDRRRDALVPANGA